jgi:hypothetical protein
MRNKKTEIETELPDDYKPIPGTIVKVEEFGGEIVAIAALFLAVLFLVLAVVRGF